LEVGWTIVQLPALPTQVHYPNYRANIYGASKNVQSCIYCASPVVGRGSSAAMVKEETKLAVFNFLCSLNLTIIKFEISF
jgi:hypothetical protein